MVDGYFEFNPLRKHHEFDLRPPATRSRMRKRMEQEVVKDIAEMMYEIDVASRERLSGKCKRVRASGEFVYVAMMIQDGISPMPIVRYLRQSDDRHFNQRIISDDALRMQIARMKKAIFHAGKR